MTSATDDTTRGDQQPVGRVVSSERRHRIELVGGPSTGVEHLILNRLPVEFYVHHLGRPQDGGYRRTGEKTEEGVLLYGWEAGVSEPGGTVPAPPAPREDRP